MNFFILTGTSRGLGEAVAKQLLQEGNHLLCISRKRNDALAEEAEAKQVDLDYMEYDLNQVDGIEQLMQHIFAKIDLDKAQGIYLLNNAGIVSPIAPIDKCEARGIIQNIHVNLIAPMLLVSLFTKHSNAFQGEKRVINISSGAAKKPYFGWSSYCTSKAGLDMLTRSVAVEQENKEYPVKILSFAPGIVDTDMQTEIRSTKEEDFVHVQQFISLKEEGNLLSPNFVAKEITKLLVSDTFEQGAIMDIRDNEK